MFNAMSSKIGGMSPLIQQLLQRSQPEEAAPPTEDSGMPMDQPMMEGPPPMGGSQGQPTGSGKPAPPPTWAAPVPQGSVADMLQMMSQNMQGASTKIKVSDPFGGSQEASSKPEQPSLPAAPPWVQKMMGQQ